MDQSVRSQVWPVFAAEAREHLQLISEGVLEIEAGPGPAGLLESMRRTAHSLKGSAASLGLLDVERIAHAVEDSLSATPREGLGAGPVEAILAALRAVEGVLDAVDAGGEGLVGDLEDLIEALGTGRQPGPRPPAPRGPPAAAGVLAALQARLEHLRSAPAEEREAAAAAAIEELGRVQAEAPPVAAVAERLQRHFRRMRKGGAEAARAASAATQALADLARLLPANPEGAAPLSSDRDATRGAPGERSMRLPTAVVDGLVRHLEALALGEARAGRRARESADRETALKEVLRLCERCASELRLLEAEGPLVPLTEAIQKTREIAREMGRRARRGLAQAEEQRIAAAMLREDLRDLRMVPASLALEPLRPMVRELAGRLGKQVELQVSGGEVRLDRRLVEELKNPLLHLVRNALDHGIEPPGARRAAGKDPTGRIEVRIAPRGSRVAMVVADDGAGLSLARLRAAAVRRGLLTEQAAQVLSDAETAQLAFRQGLSTAEEVTAVSGRGVGLDVVHETSTRLQGTVAVSSSPGTGTRFTIDLPVMLGAATVVLFRAAGEIAAVPAEAVEHVVQLDADDVGTVAGRAVARVGKRRYPFASLAQVLGLEEAAEADPARRRPALVVALSGQRAALAVDEVLGQQDLQISTLGRRVGQATHIAGAAVLDDGRVVAVLNPAEVLRRARSRGETARPRAGPRILLADDSLTTRSVMKAILEIAGYTVVPAADGEEALAALRRSPCQLVVADIQMPRLDGLALTRRIKGDPALAGIPVILITSLDAPADRAAGLHAGADGYLVKREVDRGMLLDLVRQFLPEAA